MNQAILFNDNATYCSDKQCITFTAMQQGMRIECQIATTFDSSEDAIAHFEQWRFDYEEQAEELIEAEAFSAQGFITLKAYK
ncbi:DUF1488 family protein [Pseudoalteromonas xiamenensis]